MENKIVVHMKDGVIRKGVTHDFDPSQPTFHLLSAEGGGVPIRVRVDDMKALFYVRDYMGNRDFVARRQFGKHDDDSLRGVVSFKDGEEIWGYLEGGKPEPDQPGFFFYPADKDDNNVKIFVVRSALEDLQLKS